MSEIFRDDGAERDATLAALYRAAAREEPPPAIDDAIRAAARRSVGSRPQRVSSIRAWRVPLSIAAVMVLTVSLVTIMREEAPEIMSAPGGVATVEDADQMRAGRAADARERASAVPKTLAPPAARPDSVGLKPPAQAGSSGLGLRENRVSPDPVPGSLKDTAAASRIEADAPAPAALARHAEPQAFPQAIDARDDKAVVAAEKRRQLAKEELPSPARTVEAASSAPAPAAAPVLAAGAAPEGKVKSKPDSVSAASPAVQRPAAVAPQTAGAIQSRSDLSPDKWLERIEDLRRQGRLEEARTSLGEFRKRYPDYELPASLKAWAGP